MTEGPNLKKKTGVRPWGLILLGSGLLIIGIAAALFWLPNLQPGQGADSDFVPAKVKYQAPELKLKNLDGQQAALQDYLGKVVLVNNWATWCPPCKEEMPALQEFYTRHKKEGFVLIAVEAGDPTNEVAQFAQDYGLTFEIWLDPQNKSIRAFKNYNLPNSFVIDQKGVVRLAWTGGITLENLEKYVSPFLEN